MTMINDLPFLSLIVLPALEGFHNVPLLQPLETLHNTLTYHQVDDFLGRVTSTKFPVPDLNALQNIQSKVTVTLKSPDRSESFVLIM